jgi:tetratricopeptide (TPR) repeat protein
MGDRLRQLWDFDDLEASRERLTEQLERETSDTGQAEVLTQLARVAGLAGDLDGADRLLDRAGLLGADDVAVRARVALERGRALRSSGNEAEAAPAFAEAYDLAREAGHTWLAADAAHMLAIVATTDEDRETWTGRGVDAAESSADPADAYWVGPLMNNLGWSYLEGGRPQDALGAFERALAVREREPDHPYEIEIARFAVAKALLALDRATDAIPLLERAIAWADASATPDGWFLEALAEAEGVLGRDAEAAAHARTALELLAEQDPQLADDAARADRLRELASRVGG